jgi:hypothetical protein
MKPWTLLLLVLGLGRMVAVGEEATHPDSEIVTGARTWRMADGSTKRLRFTGFAKHEQYGLFQSGNAAPGGKAFKDFSAEEQPVFAAFRSGKLKLASTPGLCMNPDFPTGKIPGWMKEDPQFWMGETRTWENSSGRRVEARLVCLTDEDASLLIGEMVSRVPLKELSDGDIAYLQQLKGGGKRTYSDKVNIGHISWDGGDPYTVAISGEKYAALAKQGSNFEEALKAVFRHIGSKQAGDKLELESFTETLWPPPGGTHSFDTQPAVPKNEQRPYLYVAEFSIKKSAEAGTRLIWPLQTTPKSWRGPPTLRIHVSADGSILEAERPNRPTP